jgi:hypothetical protein
MNNPSMELGTRLRKKDILINYEVVYRKLLTDTVIGMVTDTSVLALSIDSTETPAKKKIYRSGAFSNQGVFMMGCYEFERRLIYGMVYTLWIIFSKRGR